jgi:hypothetical protein
MRFALDENGHQPQSVVLVSDVLEFDMGRRRPSLPRVAANSSVLARVASDTRGLLQKIKVAQMADNCSPVDHARVIETMIELAGLTQKHRIIVVGSDSFSVYLDLYRRGYERAGTVATCRIPCGHHDGGMLVGWRSMRMLDGSISRAIHFLRPGAVLAIRQELSDRSCGQEIRLMLARRAFRIEAATCCEDGIVIAARRSEPLALVAA